MMKKRGLLLFCVLSSILFQKSARGLPSGAPSRVCQTMLPFHGGGIEMQRGPSPYVVTATPGGKKGVLVTISSASEDAFEGVMLQARLPDGRLAGTFEDIDQAAVHTLDCQGPNDTLTHNSANPKAVLQARWIPPAGYRGSVIFNSTVARDYATFWVGLQSDSLEITEEDHSSSPPVGSTTNRGSTSPAYTPEASTPQLTATDPFYDGCSISKLCFGHPEGCLDTKSCLVATAVTVRAKQYGFELKAIDNALWAGVGLSDDALMGDDSVIECVDEGKETKNYLSWTFRKPYDAQRIPNNQEGIELVTSKKEDGSLYCYILRDIKTTIKGRVFDLEKTPYHLLIAAGKTIYKNENKVGFHDVGFLASDQAQLLSDVSKLAGASKLLVKLHGAFMLAAWIGTASLGTFIARYFRKTWVGKTLCGKDLWFAWHRAFMVATWALTSVAFVLIFLELQMWSENNPHAILGCIVTALCFVQPIAAFFRPHPGTSKRPIFNWLHWLGGNLAHIVAIITIFFAVKLTKAQLPEWFFWIMAGFVAFHVVMHLILSLLNCVSDNSTNQRVTSFPMKDLTPGKMSIQPINLDAPNSTARKCLLALYLLVVAVFTAVLIAVVALSPI